MKLYFSPAACSLAPHIVLREAGLPFSLVQVDLATHATADGQDFRAISPRGQVPLLEVAGERLSEGAVIAQFVAERAANTALLPAVGSMARYRVQEWQNYVATELHKSFAPLFNAALDDAAKNTLRAHLRSKYEWLEAHVPAQGFLTGSGFSVADAYLFTVTRWAGFVGLDVSDLTALQAYLGRVAQRPAVQAALQAEGLAA